MSSFNIQVDKSSTDKIRQRIQSYEDRMTDMYFDMYDSWINKAKPIFQKLDLSIEEKLILVERAALSFLINDISDRYQIKSKTNSQIVNSRGNTKALEEIVRLGDILKKIEIENRLLIKKFDAHFKK